MVGVLVEHRGGGIITFKGGIHVKKKKKTGGKVHLE